MVMSALKKRKKSKESLVQRGLVLFYMDGWGLASPRWWPLSKDFAKVKE